jgi:hypothetical protein
VTVGRPRFELGGVRASNEIEEPVMNHTWIAKCACASALLLLLSFLSREAACDPALPDSAADPELRPGGAGVSQDWIPHGSYQTDYNVNRTVSTWTQGFNTPYQFGRLSLNNNVTYTYSADSNNDRRTDNRIARTAVKYNPLGGLDLGVAFDLTRTNMTTPDVTTKTKTDRDKVQLTADYHFSPLENMATTFSAKSGSVNELLENRTVERSGKGRNSTVGMTNSYKPLDYMVWNLNASGDFTSLDSRDTNTGLKTKDENSIKSYGSTLDLTPSQKWDLSLSLNRVQSQFQYPRQEAQETKLGLSNDGDLNVSLRPIDKLSLQLSAGLQHKVIDFAIERIRSTLTDERSFGWVLSYEFLGGTKLESRMTWKDERDEYGNGPEVPVSVLSQAGYLYTRQLSGSLERGLGEKVKARAVGNISLRSYQFDDKVNNPDDRDMLNYTLGLDLNYNPAPKYSAGVGFTKRADRLVYIKGENSSNNREGETYTVSADLNYRRNSYTSISQVLRVNADYSFYEYSDTKDFLIRSTDLHTVLRTKLLNKIGLQLIHDYRFQDQGGVTRTGSNVTYGRTGNNDRHDMTVKMDYAPVNGVKLEISQRLQNDKRYRLDEAGTRTLTSDNDRVELLGGLDVMYKVSDTTTVNGNFQRIDSTVEGRYWIATAAFKRAF